MSNKGGCQQEVQLLFYVQTELNYLFTNTIIKQFVLSTSLSAFVVFVALIFNLSNQMRCYLTVSFICCLSITVIEHHDPNFLKNRMFISAYSSMIQSVTEGSQELQAVTWKQKLKQSAWNSVPYQLVPHGLLSWLSYTLQYHQSKGSIVHSELGPPTLIIK